MFLSSTLFCTMLFSRAFFDTKGSCASLCVCMMIYLKGGVGMRWLFGDVQVKNFYKSRRECLETGKQQEGVSVSGGGWFGIQTFSHICMYSGVCISFG